MSFIYIAADLDDSIMKIGTTSNPANRMRGLKPLFAASEFLRYVFVARGGRAEERDLLSRATGLGVELLSPPRREWFKFDRGLIESAEGSYSSMVYGEIAGLCRHGGLHNCCFICDRGESDWRKKWEQMKSARLEHERWKKRGFPR